MMVKKLRSPARMLVLYKQNMVKLSNGDTMDVEILIFDQVMQVRADFRPGQ